MPDRQKVLVVDDSPQIHALIGVRLGELGVDLLRADSGEAGLVAAQAWRPDLVLLDVVMPGMDGFDVCRHLKDDQATRDIPVIFISALDESVNKVKGFDLGAVDYVTKPFDAAELIARVRAALNTKKLLDLLSSQASIDGLTGLKNRRYFDERLEKEMTASRRHGRPVGLLMMDVDRFKAVNDQYGHPRGDRVLRTIAGYLSTHCRASDVSCRFGGDEFGMILSDSSLANVRQLAHRLLAEVQQSRELAREAPCGVTLSIGTACSDGRELTTPAELVVAADRALYEAKTAGRNRVVCAGAEAGATAG